LDSEGYKLVDFLEQGETISAAQCVQTLNELRRVVREKRPKKQSHHSA
jgi:hypothetical protein